MNCFNAVSRASWGLALSLTVFVAGCGREEPKVYRVPKETSAVPPSQAIYIGDEVRDAEAAAKAGMAFGAVTWGQHREEILRTQKPAHIFTSVREIADKLR